ncbi:BSD domain-containing protein 1 [Brienomyrus brachyistius]|uniref:BSD domain-containing protein 1 n=1 Tax=Brienomyrus brachyistius TaxID=42636 RepID=UPI0020B2600C|nr:BSD domain-containing protein 1 [Brienomyrus brachyistius]
MADGEEGWWGGWFQQSFQAVRDKSAEAYEFLKRDLSEFGSVVQHDTACSIAATASAVRSRLAVEGTSETTEKVKKSLSNILGVITDTLAPPPDKTIDCDVITLMATPTGTTEEYDSAKARLYSLQADPATYCNEPDGPLEQFDTWLSSFHLEDKKGEISELLVNSPSIRALYTKMVPAAVAHSEFWQRYFYRVFQLDQEEARRVALKQRAERTAYSESPRWEEDEEEERARDQFCGAASASRWEEPLLSSPEQAEPASESCSLPTQLENLPEESPVQKTTKVPVEDPQAPGDPLQSLQTPAPSVGLNAIAPPTQDAAAGAGKAEDEATGLKVPPRGQSGREEGPQDLRVFELNSDSGKSTPPNSGEKGSSTDVSEDWEKDFDLDMTEEEVQLVLSKVSGPGELEEEDWESWD